MKYWIIICLALTNYATTTSEILKIRVHEQYEKLTPDERDLVEDIIDKIIDNNRSSYYFSKLILLLDTPTNPPNKTHELNRSKICKSVSKSKKERREIIKREKRNLEEYLLQEEFYENLIEREWNSYRPEFGGPFFYIVDNDPLNILVHIKVRLHGNFDMISKIILLEDAIEKHLQVTGYSVNLAFVGYSPDDGDVFDVNINLEKWPTSYNWASGYKALAHELLHLMGLPDEYDRIESHADNKNMTRFGRLQQFLVQMDDEVPDDSVRGIMCNHNFKPLERHVCASVGLGIECIRARMKAFH